jgi:hypothetical protein
MTEHERIGEGEVPRAPEHRGTVVLADFSRFEAIFE